MLLVVSGTTHLSTDFLHCGLLKISINHRHQRLLEPLQLAQQRNQKSARQAQEVRQQLDQHMIHQQALKQESQLVRVIQLGNIFSSVILKFSTEYLCSMQPSATSRFTTSTTSIAASLTSTSTSPPGTSTSFNRSHSVSTTTTNGLLQSHHSRSTTVKPWPTHFMFSESQCVHKCTIISWSWLTLVKLELWIPDQQG